MESLPQQPIENQEQGTKLVPTDRGIITPEVVNNKENMPFEKVSWSWKSRLFTHLADSIDGQVSELAEDKRIKFNINRKILSPAESDISIELNGKRKDVEDIISAIKRSLDLGKI